MAPVTTLNRALLLTVLLVAALLARPVHAQGLCTDYAAGICQAVNIPTGAKLKKCSGIPCGIEITTESRSLCSDSAVAALDRVTSLCSCASQVATWITQAPGLAADATTKTPDPITGVTSTLLTGDEGRVWMRVWRHEAAGPAAVDVCINR